MRIEHYINPEIKSRGFYGRTDYADEHLRVDLGSTLAGWDYKPETILKIALLVGVWDVVVLCGGTAEYEAYTKAENKRDFALRLVIQYLTPDTLIQLLEHIHKIAYADGREAFREELNTLLGN